MTNYKTYINALRNCAKEHENDITPFAHIRVSDLCRDTANLLEELEQEPVIDKIREEIAEYGSIWVEYKITGRRDKDIEQLVSDVLSQAKKQVLDVIDKYRGESEDT